MTAVSSVIYFHFFEQNLKVASFGLRNNILKFTKSTGTLENISRAMSFQLCQSKYFFRQFSSSTFLRNSIPLSDIILHELISFSFSLFKKFIRNLLLFDWNMSQTLEIKSDTQYCSHCYLEQYQSQKDVLLEHVWSLKGTSRFAYCTRFCFCGKLKTSTELKIFCLIKLIALL